jgi:hypothetical protein
MSITPADVQAAIDVLRQAGDESDDMDFELATELRLAISDLIGHARTTVSLLETEMLRQVEEQPRQVGGLNYMAVNKYRDRDDHDAVEARVVAVARLQAVDQETGEIDPAEAARWAAHWMRKIYVAPSHEAKKGVLDELELDVKQVRAREKVGRRLHVVDPDPG